MEILGPCCVVQGIKFHGHCLIYFCIKGVKVQGNDFDVRSIEEFEVRCWESVWEDMELRKAGATYRALVHAYRARTCPKI